MTELLFAMAFWPWFWLIAMMVALAASAAFEKLEAALAFLAFYLIVVVWWFYETNPIAWLVEHPAAFFSGVLLYTLIGIAWSLFKWRNHMKSARIQMMLKDAKPRFVESGNEGDFQSSCYFPLEASSGYQQDRIVAWIGLWPFSVLIYALGDMLVAFGKAIFNRIAGAYDRITARWVP